MAAALARRWTVLVLAVAVASIAVSAGRFAHSVGRMHGDYGHMSETERDLSAVSAAGLQRPTWTFIRAHLRRGDRYAIETPESLDVGSRRYLQTFAGYWLLPAVAVTDERHATALVYLRERGPSGAVCREAPELVCVLRRVA